MVDSKPESELSDDEFDRMNHISDTRGLSFFDARGDDARARTDHPSSPSAEPRHRHYSHRGGRAFPEPSDSELDPDYTVAYEKLSAEQREINRRGAALVRKMGELVTSPEYLALGEAGRETARDTLLKRHGAN